jgi:hypothetical protein
VDIRMVTVLTLCDVDSHERPVMLDFHSFVPLRTPWVLPANRLVENDTRQYASGTVEGRSAHRAYAGHRPARTRAQSLFPTLYRPEPVRNIATSIEFLTVREFLISPYLR